LLLEIRVLAVSILSLELRERHRLSIPLGRNGLTILSVQLANIPFVSTRATVRGSGFAQGNRVNKFDVPRINVSAAGFPSPVT
jgi:hypothetical protein